MFQEAVSYVNRRDKMLELLYFIRDKYDIKDEEDLGDENKEENLIEEELEKIQVCYKYLHFLGYAEIFKKNINLFPFL